MKEVLNRVAELPPHSVVLNTFFFEDARGEFFLEEEALDLVAGAAREPVYAIYSNDIGHGVVGGWMTDPENAGRQIAKDAARVLGGEKASTIPIGFDNSAKDTVDWRQLQRWHISENRLPPASLELFREPSVWERYRYLIVAVFRSVSWKRFSSWHSCSACNGANARRRRFDTRRLSPTR